MNQPVGVRMGTECAVHTHRGIVPQEIHHIWPLGLGGPNTPDNKIQVCANGHYAIHSLLDLYLKAGTTGLKPHPTGYGTMIKRYARRGFEATMQAAQRGVTAAVHGLVDASNLQTDD